MLSLVSVMDYSVQISHTRLQKNRNIFFFRGKGVSSMLLTRIFKWFEKTCNKLFYANDSNTKDHTLMHIIPPVLYHCIPYCGHAIPAAFGASWGKPWTSQQLITRTTQEKPPHSLSLLKLVQSPILHIFGWWEEASVWREHTNSREG